jgi:hypothetical protein
MPAELDEATLVLGSSGLLMVDSAPCKVNGFKKMLCIKRKELVKKKRSLHFFWGNRGFKGNMRASFLVLPV